MEDTLAILDVEAPASSTVRTDVVVTIRTSTAAAPRKRYVLSMLAIP